jgi:hypothetical protein
LSPLANVRPKYIDNLSNKKKINLIFYVSYYYVSTLGLFSLLAFSARGHVPT